MDRINFKVGAAGYAGCPGENGCQFKTSTALLLREGAKAKPGGHGGHLTGERRKNGTQPDTGRMLRKAAFPSQAGPEPGRQGEQGGPRCGKLHSSRIERKSRGWLEGCGCPPPCPEESGMRARSLAPTGKRGARVVSEAEREMAGSREELVGVETEEGKGKGKGG